MEVETDVIVALQKKTVSFCMLHSLCIFGVIMGKALLLMDATLV
jgi:hypothetical protein